MWNWLVSSLAVGATVVLYDGAPILRGRPVLWDLVDARARDGLRHEREVDRAHREGGRAAARDARPLGAARDPLHRQPARRPELRLRVRGGEARRAAEQHQRRHRHRLLLRARRSRRCRCGAASCRRAASAWTSSVRRAGRAGRRRRRASWCARAPFPSMPVAFWNDPDGAEVSRRVLRRLSERVAARRLGRAHAARRAGDLRPERRDAQSRRRAHRDGGDLPAGGAAARGARERRDRPADAPTSRAWTCASCCSCGSARG